MKKIIILGISLVFLGSCGQSKSDIDAAKQKILGDQASQEVSNDKKANEDTQEQMQEKSSKDIQIVALSGEQFLDFDTISQTSLNSWEVIISGKTNTQVERIEVLFSNPTSKYPDDNYTLQTFTPGDTNFRYVASSRNKVLDFGENSYVFTAKSGENISKTKVILVVPDPNTEKKGTEPQLIGVEGNTVLVDLPTSSKYGEPMKLGEASFTYTQIKGLEIKKEIIPQVSCETLTEFLTEKMNTWYYWNTCREIVKDKWIKFNVIRLDGENYIYERHYIDFENGFYGTYELETGTDVTSENIAEKNKKLKEQDFPSLEIVDDLMKDIVKS